MNLILRFFWTLLYSALRSKIEPLEASELSFRVLPTDLDLNLHMNNGRYLALMDLGRLDLILRNGLFAVMRRRRWNPVLAAARISYRKSLAPFQRYVIRTRVLGWADTSVYMEQLFLVGDRVYARAVIRAVFLGRRGRVPVNDLVASLGFTGRQPALDPRIVDMLRSREAAGPTQELEAV